VNTVGWFRRIGGALMRVPDSVAWLPAVLWAGVIWWASSISTPPSPRPDPWRMVVHNFLHAPEFGALALLALLVLPRRDGWPDLRPRAGAAIVLAVTAYGVVDELHQSHTPHRDFSLLDVLSDGNAALCVVWIAGYVGRRDATESGLARRFALGILACLVCALVASFVPRLFPGVDWI